MSTAQRLLTKALLKIEGASSPATITAYKDDFLEFVAYCEENKAITLLGNLGLKPNL